ncbi:type 1 glutamine amidotransferase [Frigoriflavimonas asaccharolytica]|uniref:GMP synthase-like glutamine amidotransferase n=1 Tax=Frigoriflavimonas asaccharolytica TaxID=2735899 RepID=A0A8J8GA32_9FLAO|nr:GMP synthase [Frigoriflavimonas asaccharolytica]NRS92742.1 GMP synthase-like glutamine amidotransferase [Frigoriflavimonas asaccharolytica]
MKTINIALLDMNNNRANQGMRNIKEIAEHYKNIAEENIEIHVFDVRFKNEIPEVKDFDIFISSGGPGTPHKQGHPWEKPYAKFLNDLYNHNIENEDKKFAFLICHSFQIASIHWKLGNICKRKSYSFGVMPMHKTVEGEQDFVLKNLPEPFYAVDSRAYQFVEPNKARFEKLGMEIMALEKMRPHIHLDRAVMAVKFSKEIFGTQFHPEADPEGMMKNLEVKKNRDAMIEAYGKEKFLQTVDRLNDDDKIVLTQQQILPRFLQHATENIMKNNAVPA